MERSFLVKMDFVFPSQWLSIKEENTDLIHPRLSAWTHYIWNAALIQEHVVHLGVSEPRGMNVGFQRGAWCVLRVVCRRPWSGRSWVMRIQPHPCLQSAWESTSGGFKSTDIKYHLWHYPRGKKFPNQKGKFSLRSILLFYGKMLFAFWILRCFCVLHWPLWLPLPPHCKRKNEKSFTAWPCF